MPYARPPIEVTRTERMVAFGFRAWSPPKINAEIRTAIDVRGINTSSPPSSAHRNMNSSISGTAIKVEKSLIRAVKALIRTICRWPVNHSNTKTEDIAKVLIAVPAARCHKDRLRSQEKPSASEVGFLFLRNTQTRYPISRRASAMLNCFQGMSVRFKTRFRGVPTTSERLKRAKITHFFARQVLHNHRTRYQDLSGVRGDQPTRPVLDYDSRFGAP